MLFHQGRHAAQHRAGQFLAGLFHLDDLEAPRQGRILLEILLVLAPGGRCNRAQLPARQSRLEQVGRIVLPRLPTRTDHRVRLVNEQNDRVRAALDLVDHILQAVLELALHRRPGLQQTHVQHVDGHALQRRRHVAQGHTQRQPFDHRRLAHARFPRQDGVVLPATHQDVDGLTDLGVSTDHRVHLSLARTLRQVGRELVQGGRLAPQGCTGLRITLSLVRRSGCLRITHRLPRLHRPLRDLAQTVLQLIKLEARKLAGHPTRQLAQARLGQQRQQHMRTADACGMRLQRGNQPRMLQQHRQVRREHRRARVPVFELAQLGFQITLQGRHRHLEALTQHRQIGLRLLQQRQHEVLQVHLEMPARHAQTGRPLGRAPRGVVELGDQGLEVLTHGDDSVGKAKEMTPTQAAAWMS